MKATLALPTIVVLVLGLGACGGSGSHGTSNPHTSSIAATTASATTTTPSRVAPLGSYLKDDGDADTDEHSKSPGTDDEQLLVAAGHGASRADRQAIATVVKSYYAAAAASDGTKGCALLHSSLVAGFAKGQSQPTTGTCAASLTPLFKQQHPRLAADDVSTMTVTKVQVAGSMGLAMLGFRAAPETEIVVEREGHAWKIDALFDSLLP